jgi:glutamate racemase
MHLGVFDSGIGGLTVLAALRRALPHADLTYLGDTARIPYGTRAPRTVVRYALQVASNLVERGVDGLVIACNTATAHALPEVRAAAATLGIPVHGVIDPGVAAAVAAHAARPDPRPEDAIAVLGTQGTISGGAYQRALAEAAPGVPVLAVAAPLFVPLVEEGWLSGPVPRQVAETYLAPLRGRTRTVILGCTHYPLLADVIAEALPGAHLVDSATATAAAARDALGAARGGATTTYLVTDHAERFAEVGARFLGARPEPVTWVDLSPARGGFAAHDADPPPAR